MTGRCGRSDAPLGDHRARQDRGSDRPRPRRQSPRPLHAVASRDPSAAERSPTPTAPRLTTPTTTRLLADPTSTSSTSRCPTACTPNGPSGRSRPGSTSCARSRSRCPSTRSTPSRAAAARNDRIAVEAFMYLHHPQTQAALEIASSGRLGTLQVVSSAFSFFLDHPNDPRSTRRSAVARCGTSAATRSASLAGSPATSPTACAGFARFDERGVDRTFVGALHFPDGLVAHFECGFAGRRPPARRDRRKRCARSSIDHPFLPAPDGPPPRIDDPSRRQPRDDRGRIGRRLSRRGRRPPGRDPGRHAASSGPRLQSR